MNFEEFRRTGELSDITVVVNKTEFKLHTFPLFTKSEYFKKAVASTSPPYVIQLDNQFPGGADVFNLLADYFYSITIAIDHKNIVPLRCAACFIECDTLSTLLDKRLDEMLIYAKARHDLGVPLLLLEQCAGEYQQWATKAHIVDKCLHCIVESSARSVGSSLNKSDRVSLVRLPHEWMVELIKTCPKESKLAILSLVKQYVTARVLQPSQPASSTENQGEQQEASAAPTKQDAATNEEKRALIDEMVKTLGDSVAELPLAWLNSVYEKAVELKCESEPALSSSITQAILKSTSLHGGIDSIPDDVMTRLLERVHKHKEDHIQDPQLLAKVTDVSNYN